MSPTGELIDTETVTISSEGGRRKRTRKGTSDYYGDSVTLGLAPVRPSRVPLVLNVSSAT